MQIHYVQQTHNRSFDLSSYSLALKHQKQSTKK